MIEKIRKQFCPQGHDTFSCGRKKSGTCVECCREYNREWYKRNSIIEGIRAENWRKNHPKRARIFVRNWTKNNPGKRVQNRLKHTTNRNLRIPNFGQEGIIEFYNNCPKGYEVDHIIPLQGKTISGLHVIWNLQYLTPRENRQKKNKFIENI